MSSNFPSALQTLLSASLPKGAEFTFHFIHSTPAQCDPLFVSPPNEPPQPTQWESHLLNVSIEHEGSLVHVLAIEVLVYETSSLTTIFVSKADSSGYLHLANLPKTVKSTIRCITSAFLEHLVASKRSNRRLVLSLFARSQPQYLFPGSAENSGKHVLDDRQLIRWWCRILDDVLTKFETGDVKTLASQSSTSGKPTQGYVVVPGLDAHEARTYIPRGSSRWSTSSPLRQLSPYPDGPERCLIPRFPDDPKARFALDLDGELPENAIQPSDATEAPEPSKTGKWRSVRSLEQFWELMAFRQECAAGRVVGFLWAVFEPVETEPSKAPPPKPAEEVSNGIPVSHSDPLPASTAEANTDTKDEAEFVTTSTTQQPVPTSPTAAAVPTITNDTAAAVSAPATEPTHDTPSHQAHHPPSTALRVTSDAYASITSLLEQLDYADLALATSSTQRFVAHAAKTAGVSGVSGGTWGLALAGLRDFEPVSAGEGANGAGKANAEPTAAAPTMLVGRKRKKEKAPEEPSTAIDATAKQDEGNGGVKRAKTEDVVDGQTEKGA